jgi:membrane protein DedA with SNARE-associated domain
MLAGALYGTWWGSLVVFVGACLGAEVVFLLGRGRLRGWARRRLAAAPKLLAVEQAVSREGLRLVLLTRLSPAFPFSLLNLAYGLSEVSLRDYTIGLIGILPGTVLFCALGALAGDVTRFNTVLAGEADPLTWVVRIVGIGATVAGTLLVTRRMGLGVRYRLARIPLRGTRRCPPRSRVPKQAAMQPRRRSPPPDPPSMVGLAALRKGLPQIPQSRNQHEPTEPQAGRQPRPRRQGEVLGAAAGRADPAGKGGGESFR